jgi:hypothetical protein
LATFAAKLKAELLMIVTGLALVTLGNAT